MKTVCRPPHRVECEPVCLERGATYDNTNEDADAKSDDGTQHSVHNDSERPFDPRVGNTQIKTKNRHLDESGNEQVCCLCAVECL